jgi:hypothetical protein
MLTAFKSPPE